MHRVYMIGDNDTGFGQWWFTRDRKQGQWLLKSGAKSQGKKQLNTVCSGRMEYHLFRGLGFYETSNDICLHLSVVLTYTWVDLPGRLEGAREWGLLEEAGQQLMMTHDCASFCCIISAWPVTKQHLKVGTTGWLWKLNFFLRVSRKGLEPWCSMGVSKPKSTLRQRWRSVKQVHWVFRWTCFGPSTVRMKR